MDIGQQQLEKARIYAYWSYGAFLIPVIGLICSAISISILQHLAIDEDDQDSLDERNRIYRHAVAMRWVSIALMVSYVILIIVGVSGSLNTVQQNAETLRLHNFYN
jgi:hypothetical protein